MRTVVFLANTTVRAIVGTGNERQISVSRAYEAQAPEGSIVNGQIMQPEVFDEFLRKFWTENHLPKRNVALMLGNVQAMVRSFEVPAMSYRKLLEYMPREFPMENRENPAFGYQIIKKHGKMRFLAATMLEKSALEPFVNQFRSMGIRLSSAAASAAAELACSSSLSCLKDKASVVQFLDGMNLVSGLFIEGACFHFTMTRVFARRGTPAFGVEIARSINNLQQFLRTQHVEEPLTQVYLAGEYNEEDLELCRESILQMDDSLAVDMVCHLPEDRIVFPEDDTIRFSAFVSLLGVLKIKKGKTNLIHQYYQDPEVRRKDRELIGYTAPAVVLAVVLGITAVVQGALWFQKTGEVSRQLDYMEQAAFAQSGARYDSLATENALMSVRLDAIRHTIDNLNSYPVYTSRVEAAILESAAGLTTARMTAFESATGTVSVETTSASQEGISQFVERLTARTDLFYDVFYDGFQYDAQAGVWKASLQCYLMGTATAGEVTP